MRQEDGLTLLQYYWYYNVTKLQTYFILLSLLFIKVGVSSLGKDTCNVLYSVVLRQRF